MHYDIGNEFWSLWLDPLMAYSGALFEQGDTLADAQARKMDYYIEGTGAVGAKRVLDVGCGWGGVLKRLTEIHGVEHATGLTLSEAQADWIRSWENPAIDVRVENWAEHVADGPYDAIISIGAFEHFARFDAQRSEKIDAYRDFFKFCHRLLPPGGRLGLQTISKGNAPVTRQGIEDIRWIWTHIFPETDVPWLSDVARASEKRFEIISVRNDPDHYVRTGEAWHERLIASRDRAIELVGAEQYALYDRWMSALRRSFESGHVGLLRLLMRRI
jgi:cyclopropane-fatty-acyl-phospholipid synthase